MGFVIDSIQGPTDQFFTRTFINAKLLPNDHDYEVFVRSIATNGCFLDSDTIEVKVFSGPPSGFTSDYNFGNANCSPLLVNFQTDVETQNLSPDEYTWTIFDAGGVVVPPSPVVKNNPLAPDFHDFNFTFLNVSPNLEGFLVRLDVTKAGVCVQSSQDIVNVFPIPSPAFIVLDSTEECDRVTYTLQANQEIGVLNYNWSFNPAPSLPPIDNGREIIITYLRPTNIQPDLSVDLNLETEGPSGCLSATNTVVQIVENQEDNINVSLSLVGPNFGCIPFVAQFTNSTVGAPAGTSYEFLVRLGGNPFDTVAVTGDIMTSFSYQFDSDGAFETVLTAISPFGCVFNSSPPIGITTFTYPQASIQASTTEGCAPLAVNFDNFSIDNTSPNSGWYVQEVGVGSPVLFSNDIFTGITFDNTSDTTKSFLVFYFAENAGGCTDADSTVITVHPEINASFTLANPDEGCGPLLQTFSLDQLQTGIQYVWDWGDGQLSDTTFGQQTVDHLFQNTSPFSTKNYMVTLTASNLSTGCQDVFSDLIRVFPSVVANVEGDMNQGCAPLPVSFTNESLGITNHLWVFSEKGGIQVAQSSSEFAQFIFQNQTSDSIVYQVMYTGSNGFGCESYDSLEITVFPEIRASYTIDGPEESCGPFLRTFQLDQLQSRVRYIWDWGDGQLVDTTNNQLEIEHLFENTDPFSSKNFSVMLTATDTITGCKDEFNDVIKVYPSVLARISEDVDNGCAPLAVSFENESLGVTQHQWRYREKGTSVIQGESSGEVALITFQNQTTQTIVYEVLYTGTNSFGCQSSDTAEVTVFSQIDASFDADPLRQSLPNSTVTLVNNSLNASTWDNLWTFGDGDSSQLIDPGSHQYQAYGEYLLRLVVSSTNCLDQTEQIIVVEPTLPIVEFTLDTTAGCRPLRVNFTNLSQFADPESYLWDFGDGLGTSVAENPTYLYDVPGIYSVFLKARNPIGLDVIEEKEFLIEVFDLPSADFLIRPDVVFLPDDPLFTSNRSRGGATYLWDFGDETTSEEFEPQHYYQDRGLYTISLTVTNDHGCTDKFSQENVVLVERGGRILIPNGFTPNPGGPSGGRVSSRNSGSNDVFLPITEGVVEFQLLIFNRWGEVLFESTNRDIGWDGYFQNRLVQSDVYVYRLNLTFANGEKTHRVGDITLIR